MNLSIYCSEGNIPIFVCVVGSFLTVCVGTVVVTTLVLSGCGSCGKWANCGCGAAFQYSVVVTGLVVTSSLLFQKQKTDNSHKNQNQLVFCSPVHSSKQLMLMGIFFYPWICFIISKTQLLFAESGSKPNCRFDSNWCQKNITWPWWLYSFR